MKAKKRRNVDIELHPQTHLNGILTMRAKNRPARALKKRFRGILRSIGSAVVFPFHWVGQLIQRGLKSTRVRLHGEKEDLERKDSLPYYKPKRNGSEYADGQAVVSMEDRRMPLDELSAKRRKKTADQDKTTTSAEKTRSKVLPYKGAIASSGSAALQMEQTAPLPRTIPKRGDGEKTKEDTRKSRADKKTKKARVNRAIPWKRIAMGLAGCAVLGLFGWYMLEGRYCVVNVFDDGYYYSVRTKEATVEEMLVEAGIELTAEDTVSVALSDNPQEDMTVSIARARNIGIAIDDGQNTAARLTDGTVEDALIAAGITCSENDAVIPSLKTPIRTDMDIQVYRAKQLYIHTSNKTIEVQLGTGTVGDALTKAGIAYDDGDQISPSAGTAIEEGMEISFMAVEIKTKTRTETIEYKTVYKDSKDYYYGQTKVSQSGKNGTRTIVEEVTYEDGKEVSRKVVSNEVTTAAVNKIVLEGCKHTSNPDVADLPAGGPPDDLIAYTVTMTQITAYTHTGNRTATGKWPKVGMCAIDRDAFEYGTVFYVPGYGYAVAEDTGEGSGDDYSMDLFMDTREECLAWGRRRNVKVYVLSED